MSRFTARHSSSRHGLWFILCAGILWGTVGIASQVIYGLSQTTPLSVSFFRSAFAFPILLGICWRLLGRRMLQVKRHDLGIMLLMGTMATLFQGGYLAAVSYSGVTMATLITICMTPVLVAFLSTIVTRERLTLSTVSALVCAVSGTALLTVSRSNPAILNSSLTGVFIAVTAACGYAGLILFGRLLTAHYHPLYINTVVTGTSALILLCLSLSTRLVVTYPMQSWLLMLYLGSITTALAYILFFIGVRLIPATIASITALSEPLTAALLAWIFFGERFGILGLLGALLLLGTIILLARNTGSSKPIKEC